MECQLTFDWDKFSALRFRGWQRQLVRSIRLPEYVEIAEGNSIRQIHSGCVIAALNCIDDHAAAGGWSTVTYKTIAAESHHGLRQVRRAVAFLDLEALIIRQPRSGQRGGRRLALRLNWQALIEYRHLSWDDSQRQEFTARMVEKMEAREAKRVSQVALRDSQVALSDSQVALSDAQVAPQRATKAYEANLSTSSKPPPDDWGEAVVFLKDCGVVAAAQSCNVAKANGARPADVLAIATAWKARSELNAGALYWRIVNAVPGDDGQGGWPGKSSSERPKRREWTLVEMEIEQRAKAAGLAVDHPKVTAAIATARAGWENGKFDYV